MSVLQRYNLRKHLVRRSVLRVGAIAVIAFALLPAMTPAIAQTAAAASNTAPQANSLEFANARLADVLRTLGTMLGRTIVLSDVPDARVTFSTAAPVKPADIEAILESLLESYGLMLVSKGAISQVMLAEKAPATGILRSGLDFPDPPPLGLVSQLVPLTSIRADEGADALRAIVSKGARIEVVARSNALLITDRGSNVARYLDLLRRLDAAPAGESGLRTYVVNLKYAAAADLADALGQLFGVSVGNASTESLADRSLSRSLDNFRARESDTFRQRNPAGTGANPTNPTQSGIAARDSAAGVLVGRTTIVPSGPTNSLVIRTAPPNYPLLRETIEALDVRPVQVLFEVTIAEIALGRGTEFGVDWAAINRGGDVNAQFGNPEIPDSNSNAFFLRLTRLDATGVRTMLRAVASKNDVRVLSTPQVLAANNREATILVGSKVPFIASTRLGNDVSIDRAVQYQDVGTKLSIIPTINDDGYVSVQLLQEVSSLTAQTVSAALSAPVISTREASTRAVLRDGQTGIIAGLIGESRETSDSGIPFLKDIPILGNLFKRQSVTRQRTELVIFVTPYIIRTDADANNVRNRMRDHFEETSPGGLNGTRLGNPPAKKDTTRKTPPAALR
ncbi:MAG: secretin N-terminal domain-containing protein [Gemmatimonadaceae bacterium]